MVVMGGGGAHRRLIQENLPNLSIRQNFGEQDFFRQFCPAKFFHRFLISPYNSQEKYVLT